VECRILLTPARLPSGASVEVCSACRGMFLDAGELAPLGVRDSVPPPVHAVPPPFRAAPASARAAPPRRVEPAHSPGAPHSVDDHRQRPRPAEAAIEQPPPGTFVCVDCGEPKPLREGQALRDGLACRSCMKARAEG